MYKFNANFTSPVVIQPMSCEVSNEPIICDDEFSIDSPLSLRIIRNRKSYVTKWHALFDKSNSQWISFKPYDGADVYPCYACRDMFGSKDSFLDHVNRRGMLIQYTCLYCLNRRNHLFYNPCSFLLHVRDHFGHGIGEINLDYVNISMLPLGLAGFFRHPDIPQLYMGEEDLKGEKILINTRFYTPTVESEGSKIVRLKPWVLLFYQPTSNTEEQHRLILKQVSSNIPHCRFVKFFGTAVTPVNPEFNHNDLYEDGDAVEVPDEEIIDETCNKTPKCTECHKIQTVKMIEHFIDNNKPINEKLKCSICKYVASTNCSLKAHERIHSGLSPFVCPECGKNFQSSVLLHEHLEDVCFHLAKHVRYRCPGRNCSKIFAASVTFATHFPLHVQLLTRCVLCQMTWESDEDFEQHNKDTHGSTLNEPEKVYKCSVCKAEAFQKEQYLEHINAHCTDSSQRVYVFTCKHCKNYFRSRETYAVHLLRCSKLFKFKTKSNESTKSSLQPDPEVPKDEIVNCIICNIPFSVLEIREHLRQVHCKSKTTETFGSPPKPINPIILIPPEKRSRMDYNCKVCNYFDTDREEFQKHILQHKDDDKIQCSQCGECFETDETFEMHRTEKHLLSFEEAENSDSSRSSEKMYACDVCNEEFTDELRLNKHFRVHGLAFLKNTSNNEAVNV